MSVADELAGLIERAVAEEVARQVADQRTPSSSATIATGLPRTITRSTNSWRENTPSRALR